MAGNADYPFAVTVQTTDIIVVGALRGISFEIQRGSGFPQQASGGTGQPEWEAAGQQVTFRFSDSERRLRFINEAIRILGGGHWSLVALTDN
jgi:hypothetical protein